jgi:hypothetical protein
LLLLVLLVSDQNISARTRMPIDMPALVLWAWDRDDDLSFIDIRDTAVAYLAATVILRGETVLLTPRHHPLAPPQGTRLIAVAHVEVDRYEPPVMSDAQALAFAETLAALRAIRPGEFLQIDFEATASQRAFFVQAVAALRERLPDATLSATAPDVVVLARTVDAVAGGGRGSPDALPHGPRSPAHPGVFRRRGRFSLGQLPHQHRRRDG